jgi:hypothetical protein
MPNFHNDPITSNIDTGNISAVFAKSHDGRGLEGWSTTAYGASGDSEESAGVRGTSKDGHGLEGWSTNAEGVWAISTNGDGVSGQSTNNGRGVAGFGNTGPGVYGHSDNQAGIVGESTNFDGVYGIAHKPEKSAITGHNPGGVAGLFVGNVVVTGFIEMTNGDCAEDFDISAESSATPGTVMVLDDEGKLRESFRAYDKRVAGVISGAGSHKPGLVLGKQQPQSGRMPLALLGKVFCKVDAHYGCVEVGDMLTTSPTAGHAMRADDPSKAFGAVVGKALRPLISGQSLIPILVALQ